MTLGDGAPLGELTDTRPVAHQEIDGRRTSLDSRHAHLGGDRYGFAIDADYDRGRPLVISAALAYSTFLGAVGADSGRGVAIDGSGTRT